MVADTYSPSLGAIEQGTGNNNNSWGANLNGALTALDLGVAGYATNAVTGGNLALDGVIPPAGQHPLVQMLTNFTGVLASNQTVTVPNVSKLWLVANNTTGAFTLKFKTTTGAASAAIPQGGSAFVYCDGANNMFVGLSTSLRDVQWLGADGTIAAPGISFATEPGLGLRRVSAGVMALTVAGVDIITISGTAITVSPAATFSSVPSGTEANSAAIAEPAGWYFEFGQTKVRATDTPLMNAITQAFTATTNNTTTLSAVSADLRNLGLEGSVLEGTGIFTGATIVSITVNTIVMSNAATNAAVGGTVRAFPYGNGDGSTTFNLPDARGSVAAGRGNMGGTDIAKLTVAGSGIDGTKLNATGGAETVTLNTTQIPAHTHANSLTDPGHVHQVPIGGPAGTGYASATTVGGISSASLSATTGITITNASIGGGLAHNNAQWTRIRNVIIKR